MENLPSQFFVYPYMKRILQFLLFLVIIQNAICQQSNLDQFNIERQKISKTGLKVLTAYSLANVLYGSISSSQSGSGSDKYFYKMNAIFNGITLGFVGIGFIMAKKEGKKEVMLVVRDPSKAGGCCVVQ